MVKSAGGAFAGIGGAGGIGWPAGIFICPSATDAEVIPASCANRLRVSNAKLLVAYRILTMLAGGMARNATAGDRPQDDQRFCPARHSLRQRRIGGIVRQILLAREEAQKGPPLQRRVVADSTAQHGVRCLQRIQYRANRRRCSSINLNLVPRNSGQRPQVRRQFDTNLDGTHASVCTSTDSTGGRSRTIALQLSPASADAYTWPPLVPKYTPQESSLSTAIASRSTFT